MLYRHEDDEKGQTVVLNNECNNCNSVDYRVRYAVPNVKPGRYICQMQSKCEFGVSGMSNEISVWKNEEVSYF